VTGLDVYTEYEFQVLAYTSVGDGPKSSTQYERTKEEENKAIGIKTGGREALRDGKSLFLSGHVKEAKYHGISYNIAYCFVKAKVMLTLILQFLFYNTVTSYFVFYTN